MRACGADLDTDDLATLARFVQQDGEPGPRRLWVPRGSGTFPAPPVVRVAVRGLMVELPWTVRHLGDVKRVKAALRRAVSGDLGPLSSPDTDAALAGDVNGGLRTARPTTTSRRWCSIRPTEAAS